MLGKYRIQAKARIFIMWLIYREKAYYKHLKTSVQGFVLQGFALTIATSLTNLYLCLEFLQSRISVVLTKMRTEKRQCHHLQTYKAKHQ